MRIEQLVEECSGRDLVAGRPVWRVGLVGEPRWVEDVIVAVDLGLVDDDMVAPSRVARGWELTGTARCGPSVTAEIGGSVEQTVISDEGFQDVSATVMPASTAAVLVGKCFTSIGRFSGL